MSSRHGNFTQMVLAAMFALVINSALFTGQIPQIGSALSPMHIPVLLSGFFCKLLFLL